MKHKLAYLLVGAILVAVIVSGCIPPAADPANVRATATSPNAPIDYGNGVYYFPYVGADFANALSSFRKANPDMEQESMTGDAAGGYGVDSGYFVTFHNVTPVPTEKPDKYKKP